MSPPIFQQQIFNVEYNIMIIDLKTQKTVKYGTEWANI